MINSGAVEKRSVHLQILTEDQISEIKQAAFDIMQNIGFKVLHEGARKMLKQAGTIVNNVRVLVPEHIV